MPYKVVIANRSRIKGNFIARAVSWGLPGHNSFTKSIQSLRGLKVQVRVVMPGLRSSH
jgi:hypothetical protein